VYLPDPPPPPHALIETGNDHLPAISINPLISARNHHLSQDWIVFIIPINQGTMKVQGP
jgi:hypothetical protein